MLQINGKTFMNLQEAVQWLLDNNALPFQSSANYIANTEIGMGTIVNPSPAKVRIGSLIFFADSKVSTVIGLTENGFICSDQYNNLVDDIAYVTNVAINASGHLITTLSDGQTIDAGIVKQVSGFSINSSQHLIVSFNDGTSTDLGAIFTGNVNISGNFTADSIIENMIGYSATVLYAGFTKDYVGCVKTGNKITFAIAGTVTTGDEPLSNMTILKFDIPYQIGNKLIPHFNAVLAYVYIPVIENEYQNPIQATGFMSRWSNQDIRFLLRPDNLEGNKTYYFRVEFTFLLSNSLV